MKMRTLSMEPYKPEETSLESRRLEVLPGRLHFEIVPGSLCTHLVVVPGG